MRIKDRDRVALLRLAMRHKPQAAVTIDGWRLALGKEELQTGRVPLRVMHLVMVRGAGQVFDQRARHVTNTVRDVLSVIGAPSAPLCAVSDLDEVDASRPIHFLYGEHGEVLDQGVVMPALRTLYARKEHATVVEPTVSQSPSGRSVPNPFYWF